MLILSISFILLVIAVLTLLPSIKLRILFGGYFSVLYLLLAGLTGMVESSKGDYISQLLIYSIDVLVICFHLPIVYRLFKMDFYKTTSHRARNHFGQDLWYLTDDDLNHHQRRPF